MWHRFDKYFARILLLTILMIVTVLLIFMLEAEASYEKEYTYDPIKEQVSMLAVCESSYTATAYVEHDPVTPSIGLLQFKTETFNHFSNYYGLTLDIWNPEHQKILAWHMLSDERYSHWLRCSKQLGFLP